MKIDRQILKQCEITLRHLAKDLRKGEVDAGKVGAYSKLISEYASLVRLSQELNETSNNYYDQMEREALSDARSKRQEVQDD